MSEQNQGSVPEPAIAMSEGSAEPHPAQPVEAHVEAQQPVSGSSWPVPEASWTPPPGASPRLAADGGWSNPWRKVMAAAIVAAIAGVGGGIGVGFELAKNFHNTSVAQSPIKAAPQNNPATSGSLNLQAIAAKVDPVIVDINTVIESGSGSGQGAATGIILTSSGEVLTNNHVVLNATSITVTITGRSETYTAHVVGVDPTADVALIQLEGVSGLPTASLADSSTLQVGEQVAAIGNALGRGGAPNITSGTITALDQSITASEDNGATEQLSGMIESDASIVPGDSGGALVNSAGQVVGMITAGQASGFRYQSSTTGYAVPSSAALDIVNQIRSGQSSAEVIIGAVGYLGVRVQNMDAQAASTLGLSITSGALIRAVTAGSPAEKAGIPQYAVITEVSGMTISTANDLGTALHTHKPGDSVQVTWVDTAGTHSATAILSTGPAI